MPATVILPTYNERENIGEILRRIREAQPQIAILVVDDSSPDGTAQVADDVARQLGNIEVVTRESKDGLGSAYRFAFQRLFGISEPGHVIVTMDSDLSHDPAAIQSMLQEIDAGADAVVGSRYVDGGGTLNWPLHRRLLSRWGNRYTGWVLGISIRDCTSGFRAYRMEALRAIEPQSTKAEGYAFLTELVLRLTHCGFNIAEVPILFVDRRAGTSKMSGRIVLESMSLVTRWGLTRRLRPWFKKGRPDEVKTY